MSKRIEELRDLLKLETEAALKDSEAADLRRFGRERGPREESELTSEDIAVSIPSDVPVSEVTHEQLDALSLKDFVETRNEQEDLKRHPEPDEPEEPGTENERQQPRRRNGWQKRVDKLTARKPSTRVRTRRSAQGKASVTSSCRAAPSSRSESNDDEVSKRDAFDKEQAEANRRHETAAKDHPTRVAKAREKYSDFDTTLKSAPPVPMVVLPFIKELPNGAETAYHLAKHPEICAQLMSMNDPSQVLRTIERISGAVEYSPVLRPAREKPRPPAPIAPVGGSHWRKLHSDGSIADERLHRIRDSQERARRR